SFSKYPECEVRISSVERANIRFARNGITTSGFTIEQSMTIASTRDGKSGRTTATEFDDARLREAVQRTEELAAVSPVDAERVQPLGPQKYALVENYSESTARARNEAMIPHIRAVIESAKARNLVAAGFFERLVETAAIANKRGNFGYGRITDA